MLHEGPNVEFKQSWSESIKKTIVAFANTDGGTIYIGMTDHGEPIGVDDADDCLLKTMQAAGNAIKPDVTLFTRAHIEEIDTVAVVVVEVQRGAARPYYLAEKGIRPAGVYVRQGALSAPASDAAILAMIRESSGESFEDSRSLEQRLSFDYAQRVFAEAGISFEDRHMRTLGLTMPDGSFTNLALLLSDQCPATVKAAVFDGLTKLRFRDRFEFEGSLFRQFHEVLHFFDLHNQTRSEIGPDLRRVDERDYPDVAVREVLLNMFVHRDYAVPGPALVSIFDDRAEFLNIGGLRAGITENDMLAGVSVQRNPRLARVLYRLKWIEAYGTGVPKIMESYQTLADQPLFHISDNAFKVTLPSAGPFASAIPTEGEKAVLINSAVDAASLSRVEYAVVQLAEERGEISRKEIEQELGLSQSAAIRLLDRMQKLGLLRKFGQGKNTRYSVYPSQSFYVR
ncbi:RNA-binding domain-containing protein [Eggerthella sp. YY7918]|uniref:RNA-binding domain-containing protein n=1 Tax=Eggerthella sp. (strain YY7918) TaxID=502558 RepID=UPI0002171478|nr:RNA-binding domain-containing protein [Eggerthella sp. YY7918]BAK45398.1 hypothetical protein EGYY_23270 [Eggerthella sp. YY7918]